MVTRYRLAYVWFCIASLIGCGRSTPTQSNLDVTNGISIGEEEFPAVVLIMKQKGSESDDTEIFCTASFINDYQALTAAHCLGSATRAEAPLFIVRPEWGSDSEVPQLRAIAQAVRVHIHPDYAATVSDELSPYDLAVLDFPTGTAASSIDLVRASPPLNSKVTLVGYGNPENLKGGKQSARKPSNKRYGSNTVRSSNEGFLSLTGLTQGRESLPLGKQVATASGDSGSPWLLEGQLASVTIGSKIQRQTQGQELNLTYAVDLHSESSRKFLAEIID